MKIWRISENIMLLQGSSQNFARWWHLNQEFYAPSVPIPAEDGGGERVGGTFQKLR